MPGRRDRKLSTAPAAGAAAASGTALALGALLDGIPESAAIGVTFLEGGAPSLAFIAAVALSNLPEGLSSSTGMRAAGHSVRYDHQPVGGDRAGLRAGGGARVPLPGRRLRRRLIAFVMTFAAGAILSMLASTMLPEAAREGGPVIGLVTSAGFLAAVLMDRV